MLRALRHDLWATEKLLAHLRTLTKEQLELTAPGTYGSIRQTLAHLVRGDERYLMRLGVLTSPHTPIGSRTRRAEMPAYSCESGSRLS